MVYSARLAWSRNLNGVSLALCVHWCSCWRWRVDKTSRWCKTSRGEQELGAGWWVRSRAMTCVEAGLSAGIVARGRRPGVAGGWAVASLLQVHGHAHGFAWESWAEPGAMACRREPDQRRRERLVGYGRSRQAGCGDCSRFGVRNMKA